jgi:hypothetical protein
MAVRGICVGFCFALSFSRAGEAGDVRHYDILSHKEWLRVSGDVTGGSVGRPDGFDIERELEKEIVYYRQLSQARQVAREWLIRNVRRDSEMLTYEGGAFDMGTYWNIGFSPPLQTTADGGVVIDESGPELHIDKFGAVVMSVSCNRASLC